MPVNMRTEHAIELQNRENFSKIIYNKLVLDYVVIQCIDILSFDYLFQFLKAIVIK